jgi:uncharacterized membrane protein YeiH
METLLLSFDLAGTFVFALSGALAGVKRKLDLFGVLVLSFAAANSGGIARDILIGAVPPGAISDWRYLGISLAAGLLTFYFSPIIIRMWNPVLLFDAAGLALFAVSGAQKALNHGLDPSAFACWRSVTAGNCRSRRLQIKKAQILTRQIQCEIEGNSSEPISDDDWLDRTRCEESEPVEAATARSG